MPHYTIPNYHEPQLAAFDFTVRKGAGTTRQRVEGRQVEYRYNFDNPAGGQMPGVFQILSQLSERDAQGGRQGDVHARYSNQ